MRSAKLLPALEEYYDAVPRASASTEEIGPFTLFVRSDPDGGRSTRDRGSGSTHP